MKLIGYVFVGFTIMWRCASAQEQLTLQECIDRARKFNLKSREAELALRASSLSRDELATTGLPQLKVGSDVSYAPWSGKSGYDPAITDGGQLGARVSVQQSLYDAGARKVKLGQLAVEHEALTKEKQMSDRDLVATVGLQFIEALRSRLEIDLQLESMRQLKEYLELVERLAKGGGAGFTDVLKTRVQLESAERSLQKAQESHATAKFAFSELLGGSIDTSFTVAGDLESLFHDDLTGVESFYFSQNLDVALAELNVNKSTFEVELAKSERLPVISASADAGLLTSFDNIRLPASERLGMFGYTVGVMLEVPLFTWGATDLRIQQRELTTQILGLQLEGVRRSVTTEYQKVRLQLRRSADRLRSIRGSLRAAEENFALTKARYVAGGVLSLEVLSAQQLVTDLRLEELQTLADGQILRARFERIISQ